MAFGPNYRKFKEARDLVTLGAARSVTNYEQLRTWFVPLRDNEEFLLKTSRIAKDYTTRHQGSHGYNRQNDLPLNLSGSPSSGLEPARRRFRRCRRRYNSGGQANDRMRTAGSSHSPGTR